MTRESLQQALAGEILAEVARQRFTAREVQRRANIKSGSWQNYIVRCTRAIPIGVVYDIAEVLGLRGSELMARAESRTMGGDLHAERAARLLEQMTPEAAESLRRALQGPRETPGDEDRPAGRDARGVGSD